MELPTPSLCHPNNHPKDLGPPPSDAASEPHLASAAVSPTVACNLLECRRAATLGAPWSHLDFHEMGRHQLPPLTPPPLKTRSHIYCAGRLRLWTFLARGESPAKSWANSTWRGPAGLATANELLMR